MEVSELRELQAPVKAEGKLDFRGTLGVSHDAPVGFKEITLNFVLDTDVEQSKVDKLIKLKERYCVIYQTLKNSPALETAIKIK